jgi:hypothetical protein
MADWLHDLPSHSDLELSDDSVRDVWFLLVLARQEIALPVWRLEYAPEPAHLNRKIDICLTRGRLTRMLLLVAPCPLHLPRTLPRVPRMQGLLVPSLWRVHPQQQCG